MFASNENGGTGDANTNGTSVNTSPPWAKNEPSDEEYASNCMKLTAILNNVGVLNHRRGDACRAMKCYKEAMNVFNKSLGARQRSFSHIKSRYEAVAEEEKEIMEGTNHFGQETLEQVCVFDVPTDLEDNRDMSHISCRALRIESPPDGPPQDVFLQQELATILHNVALIHYERRNIDNALKAFKLALDATTYEHYRVSSLMPSIHRHIGHLLFKKGMIQEATQNFVQQSKIMRYKLEQQSEVIATTQDATVHQNTCTIQHQLRSSLCELANVYYACGKYSKAMSCCEEALSFEQTSCTAEDFHIQATKYNMGRINHKQGHLEDALNNCVPFGDLAVSELGERHHISAHVLHTIGILQLDAHKFSAATKTIVRCLTFRREVYGEFHPYTAETMIELGVAHMEVGQCTFALNAFQRALEITQKISIKGTSRHALILSFMGQTHFLHSGDLDQALKLFKEVINMLESTFSGNYTELEATVLMTIGEIHLARREIGDAVASFTAAERILPDSDGLSVFSDLTYNIYFNPYAGAAAA